jgi:aspartyl-tRNA(Asn)/glutamyl-tRNA(Gln) amidotransferase subunit C
MITKEKLKDYAGKLMFDMKDEEYDTLINEFDIILKQMDLIGKIKDIESVTPMTFSYDIYTNKLREDIAKESLTKEELFLNVKEAKYDQVKVTKVVV